VRPRARRTRTEAGQPSPSESPLESDRLTQLCRHRVARSWHWGHKKRKQTKKQRNKQRNKQRKSKTKKQAKKQTSKQKKQRNKQRNKETNKETKKQTNKISVSASQILK